MKNSLEKPFEYLRRLGNGEPFGEETVRNWYIARAYVLDRLKDVAFGPTSSIHLHVVVTNDSPLMLSVVRHVALAAHFINFDEDHEDESRRNRTVITLVSRNPKIKDELEKEEYLCHLPKHCKFVTKHSGTDKGEDAIVENGNSYIDIEIHIVEEFAGDDNGNCLIIFSEEDVRAFQRETSPDAEETIFSIDTRKAVYANRIYTIGEMIDNLPAEDIHSAKRYSMALDIFLHDKLKRPMEPLVNKEKWKNIITARERISNIFCADCFETRAQEIEKCATGDKNEDRFLWEKYNEQLSISEHARWVVEKLIMGYSPLSPRQRFKDESLFYDKKRKAQYRKYLKKQSKAPAHIDLCSYADLRRLNPADMKYDTFMVLAIPLILKKIKG